MSPNEIFYSNNIIHKPVKVVPLENYILHIEYEDGKIIEFSMKDMLNHPLFKPLKEKVFFELVQIKGSSLSWPNDIELCADSLYSIEK